MPGGSESGNRQSAFGSGWHRFFVSPHQVQEGEVTLEGEEAYHAARVLRLRPGDRLVAVVPGAREYVVRVTRSGPRGVTGRIEGQRTPATEPPLAVTLYQGLARGSRMDLVVQKATELGVARVVPVACERSVAQVRETAGRGKRERWQRIAREAAAQCGRLSIPPVEAPMDLEAALQEVALQETAPPRPVGAENGSCPGGVAGGRANVALMLWEGAAWAGLREVLEREGVPGRCAVFVGPEGGFAAGEVERAVSCGVIPVSLGPRILRTETAGIAALSIILYRWGDVGIATAGDGMANRDGVRR